MFLLQVSVHPVLCISTAVTECIMPRGAFNLRAACTSATDCPAKTAPGIYQLQPKAPPGKPAQAAVRKARLVGASWSLRVLGSDVREMLYI